MGVFLRFNVGAFAALYGSLGSGFAAWGSRLRDGRGFCFATRDRGALGRRWIGKFGAAREDLVGLFCVGLALGCIRWGHGLLREPVGVDRGRRRGLGRLGAGSRRQRFAVLAGWGGVDSLDWRGPF